MDNRGLTQTAAPWVPEHADIEGLRKAAEDCKGCELWQPATQVVFSAGNPRAPLALVGEQPGDVEDRKGIPFVGPAGRLLQDALDEAGVPREDVYVTNAVKHFRFTERGKRRIHATPQVSHIKACLPWLEAELTLVDPALIVCLGATAARALLGSTSGSPSSVVRCWSWRRQWGSGRCSRPSIPQPYWRKGDRGGPRGGVRGIGVGLTDGAEAAIWYDR